MQNPRKPNVQNLRAIWFFQSSLTIIKTQNENDVFAQLLK